MPASRLIEGLAYGPDPSQVGDLHLPDGGHPPVVCLLHGGFWRMPYGREQMTPLAQDLAARGYAAWNLEYRRIGGGGGWPATMQDVAAGIDFLAGADVDLDLDRVVAVGHSAGGHLALWAAGRHRAGVRFPSPRVRLRGAVGQAPACDLAMLHDLGISRGVAAEFIGGPPEVVPERYAASSPKALLPLGVAQLLVHGDADDAVPVEMSRAYAAAARTAGDPIELVELPGKGHFEHLDTRDEAWGAVLAWLQRQL